MPIVHLNRRTLAYVHDAAMAAVAFMVAIYLRVGLLIYFPLIEFVLFGKKFERHASGVVPSVGKFLSWVAETRDDPCH